MTYDPVGWHNYKFFYGDGTKEAWLMSRGHLIGYQFSGLNDEKRNLVPMTNWLNAGNYSGTDELNQSSMLYYENRLDSWLANHPNYYLDYKVTPIYQEGELIPRKIELQYVGIDENGKLLEIKLESSKEKIDKYSVTHVILDNVSPNAEINYLDGTAKNTVESAEEKAKKEAEEKLKKKLRKRLKKKLRKKQKLRRRRKKRKKRLVKQNKKRKRVRNQTRNQQIQVVISKIPEEDGINQMASMPLRKKLKQLDCSGRKNLVDIQSKNRCKAVFCCVFWGNIVELWRY